MIQNPKAIKEMTKTDQKSHKPSQKINDKLGKKIFAFHITD